MKKILLFSLLGFLLTTCQSTKKTTYAPEKIIPTDKSLLWKISGNGLKKTSYLFGTIHLIPKNQFAFSASTLSALKSAGRVTFEIDMREMTNLRTQLGLISKAFMAGNKTLRDLLPPEDYAFVRQKLDDKGMPLTMLERLKPMFLSTMFGSDEESSMFASSGMTSVELEIFKISKKQKMESAGLETAAYQMAIFDSIPYADQAKMLVETLRSSEGGNRQFDKMIELYRAQDIEGMQKIMLDDEAGMKDYEDILLGKRNRNWLGPMGRMMRDKPTFFAVGAGHLGGKNGVIALLRGQGYRVEPVF